MTWSELCEDPKYTFLQDVPFKVELNRWGNIVMSPTRNIHGLLQIDIGSLLRALLPEGRAISECAVNTAENTKVADVAWISLERYQSQRELASFNLAPEICVEILSPTNTTAEMLEKQELYFGAGAREFWLCSEQGAMRFFAPNGELTASAQCPGFPSQLEMR